MSQKLMPRLGSAIASTILSYAAVSLAGVDQAQAALLTYNFQVKGRDSGIFKPVGGDSSFFKVSNSSLTGIGVEEIAVSEGRFYDFTFGYPFEESKEYYNLAGASVVFYQGDFRGLEARGWDEATRELGDTKWSASTDWDIFTFYLPDPTSWKSVLYGREYLSISDQGYEKFVRDLPVSYTLVRTEPEPVPEPLTAGTAAVALAGLSWLKHKKKMAA